MLRRFTRVEREALARYIRDGASKVPPEGPDDLRAAAAELLHDASRIERATR